MITRLVIFFARRFYLIDSSLHLYINLNTFGNLTCFLNHRSHWWFEPLVCRTRTPAAHYHNSCKKKLYAWYGHGIRNTYCRQKENVRFHVSNILYLTCNWEVHNYTDNSVRKVRNERLRNLNFTST